MTLFLLLPLALAATPAELAAAVPDAQAQLRVCAEQGCDDADGAKAAWVVCLHDYLETGEAKGELAATVASLEPELFAALPEVLQRSATEPLVWPPQVALSVDVPATTPPPWVEPTPAQLKRARRLDVVVLDFHGEPIPNAIVYFPVEGERHHVNTVTGRWSESVLMLRDGSTYLFEPDTVLSVHVFAPGYSYTRVKYVVRKRGKNLLPVTLTPWEPEFEASPVAQKAKVFWERWVAAEGALARNFSIDSAKEAVQLRDQTATAARDWLDAGGGDDAYWMCMMTGTQSLCGEVSPEAIR